MMNRLTVEETNLLSIYIGEDRQELTDNLTAALRLYGRGYERDSKTRPFQSGGYDRSGIWGTCPICRR